MNRPVRIVALALATALVFTASGAAPGFAGCSYLVLAPGSSVFVMMPPQSLQFTPSENYWTAVGVRPHYGEDWDLEIDAGPAAEPACVGGTLATSTYAASAVDVVVGDFNHNTIGTYYGKVAQFSGSSGANVQWDAGTDLIPVNSASIAGAMTASDVVRVWDVYLVSGQTYTFGFYPQGGAGAHLLLFRNVAGGTYWAGRGSAEFDITGPATYVATVTGYCGVVLANDAGRDFTYEIGVTSNGCSIPTVLNDLTPIPISAPAGRVAFDVEYPDWVGVALRANANDWDLTLFDSPAGGSPPECFGTPLASSNYLSPWVDFVLGDYTSSPFGWNYAEAYPHSGSGSASLQYMPTLSYLMVNGKATPHPIAATDLAHLWMVRLQGGHSYTIDYSPSASGLPLMLFANPGGGTCFVGRSAAVLVATSTTSYTAPVTGWYAAVIANDAATAGSYSLAFGDCSLVTSLAAGVEVSAPAGENAWFSFTQAANFWTAVGVIHVYNDWDALVEGGTPAAWPDCRSPMLALSNAAPPRMDFVVGDFNYNTMGTYYLHAHQYAPAWNGMPSVLWDSGADEIVPNDNNPTSGTISGATFLRCWDVYLVAGQTYRFSLATDGYGDLHLLLFRNPGGTTYWAGRGSAVVDVTPGDRTYTAPSSGFYGAVLVDDDGQADRYWIQVLTCPPAVSLSPASPYAIVDDPLGLLTFTQSNPYWTGIATRELLASQDWDLDVGGSLDVSQPGWCLASVYEFSAELTGTTDYVVGNFNFNTFGTYATRAYRAVGVNSPGQVRFAPGTTTMGVGTGHVGLVLGDGDLLQLWDVYLVAGATYTLFFNHEPALAAQAHLFHATTGPEWVPRRYAFLKVSHSTTFTAPSSGWYGLAVVNDGGSGTCNVGIDPGTAGAEAAVLPERDALRGVSPNPGRAGFRLEYALRAGGDVAFEVLDMAGRRVARWVPGEKGAGTWSAVWTANDDAGRPLAPGLYFVRMRVGERTIGTRKLTLLD